MADVPGDRRKKDRWDKVGVFFHPLGGLLTALSVAFVGVKGSEVLERRLLLILARYFGRLSPIADVKVTEEGRICATDLARRRRVWDDARFRYVAEWQAGQHKVGVPVEVAGDGAICLRLPKVVGNEPYVVVTIANGVSTYPLRVHLGDQGKGGGYRLVGLERQEER